MNISIYIKLKKVLLGCVLVLLCMFSLVPMFAQAQTPEPGGSGLKSPDNSSVSYQLLEPLPCLDSSQGCTKGELKPSINFSDYIQYMFTLFIAISAAAAVLMIVWGGFQYVTVDSFTGKSNAKKTIQQALQGLLLVLCSFLILRTIDPRLVAIPSTLVKPLTIQVDTNLTKDFFYKLFSNEIMRQQRIADENTKLAQQSRDSNKIINDKIIDLETKKSALPVNSLGAINIQKEIEALKSNPAYKKELEIQTITLTKAAVAQATAVALADVGVVVYEDQKSFNPYFPLISKISKILDYGIEQMEGVRTTRVKALQDLGSSQEKIQTIHNEVNFGQVSLLLKKAETRITAVIIGSFQESNPNPVVYEEINTSAFGSKDLDTVRISILDDTAKAQEKISRITDQNLKSLAKKELLRVEKLMLEKLTIKQ